MFGVLGCPLPLLWLLFDLSLKMSFGLVAFTVFGSLGLGIAFELPRGDRMACGAVPTVIGALALLYLWLPPPELCIARRARARSGLVPGRPLFFTRHDA